MSSDNFDNEVSKLYQQRKAQVIAPNIAIDKSSTSPRQSLFSILAILSGASVVSFGIMAIISHFSNEPIEVLPAYNTVHKIEITDTIVVEEVNNVLAVKKPLPPKPVVNNSNKTTVLSANRQVMDNFIEPTKLATAQIPLVILPELKEPERPIQPIYKVLPQYSINSLKNKELGVIKLKYQITAEGRVNNISIVNSSVSRQLQQSATKALAQWKYTPGNSFKENYEIIFEFTANKN